MKQWLLFAAFVILVVGALYAGQAWILYDGGDRAGAKSTLSDGGDLVATIAMCLLMIGMAAAERRRR